MEQVGLGALTKEFSKIRGFALVASQLVHDKSRNWRRIHEILTQEAELSNHDFDELRKLVEQDQLIQVIGRQPIKKKKSRKVKEDDWLIATNVRPKQLNQKQKRIARRKQKQNAFFCSSESYSVGLRTVFHRAYPARDPLSCW